MRPVVPITLALALAMTIVTPARADEAAEHFALAVSAEKRQDWQAAIDEYAKAYAIKPHPSVLYNIGRNYERLEDWANAAEYFKRYLQASPTADDREKVEQRIVALEEKAKAARPPPRVGTGWLVVMADVDGADVAIDGQPAGTTPYQGELAAGHHRVTLTKIGYRTAEREVEVPPGGTEQIRETMPETGEKPPVPVVPRKAIGFVLGGEYGYSFGSTTSFRLAGFVGLRLWEVFEVDALAIASEERAYGVETRLFFGRGDMLPYVHAAATIGHTAEEDLPSKGAEAGVGFLWRSTNPQQVLHYGLFTELSARYQVYGDDGDAMTMLDRENDSRFAILYVVGLLID